MSKSQFLKLHNGAVINLDMLQMILRRGVNDYAIVLQHSPAVAAADSGDVAAIERYLSEQGMLDVVPSEEVPPSKLVVTD